MKRDFPGQDAQSRRTTEQLKRTYRLILAGLTDAAAVSLEIHSTRGNQRLLAGPWQKQDDFDGEIAAYALTQGRTGARVIMTDAKGDVCHAWPLADVFAALSVLHVSPAVLGLAQDGPAGDVSLGV